jgi:hypothetical protein
MRKTMLMLITALAVLATPAMAQNYHRGGHPGPAYHGGHGGGYRTPGPGAWVGPALGGMALGAIVGGIIANQPPAYAPPPAYYAPPPAYYAPPPVIYQAVPAYAPMICRMVPYDVLPNGTTMFRQECRD